jgi:protein gp37
MADMVCHTLMLDPREWPLAWWGDSAWDQASADAAMEHLARIHAAGGKTWLSLEPLLSRVDLPTHPPIDWLVVGPETGPGKRLCEEIWMDMLGGWCREVAQIPVWFKGMGDGWPHERPEGMVPR